MIHWTLGLHDIAQDNGGDTSSAQVSDRHVSIFVKLYDDYRSKCIVIRNNKHNTELFYVYF